jgi:hypothetical protein
MPLKNQNNLWCAYSAHVNSYNFFIRIYSRIRNQMILKNLGPFLYQYQSQTEYFHFIIK